MKQYKFRAECQLDVARLMIKTFESNNLFCITDWNAWTSTPIGADIEIEVSTNCSIGTLRSLMSEIPDGHVMVETLAPSDSYTGERIAILSTTP